MRRRSLNGPIPFLWLSPLWRGTGPLFEQFRIPFIQGWVVPRGIKIGLLILKEKIFSNINTCKYGFPYCGPSRSLWTIIWTILNFHYIINTTHSGSILENIFEWPHPSLHYIRKLSCKFDFFWLSGSWEKDFYNIVSPTVASPDHAFYKLANFYKCQTLSFHFLTQWFMRKNSEYLSYISTYNNFFYCDSIRPLGTIIWTNLNLHYIRNLSCKCELFWLSGFSGKFF